MLPTALFCPRLCVYSYDFAEHNATKSPPTCFKCDKPFDAAAVHKIFAAFQDAAAKMPCWQL
jgi:hypothetical protein